MPANEFKARRQFFKSQRLEVIRTAATNLADPKTTTGMKTRSGLIAILPKVKTGNIAPK